MLLPAKAAQDEALGYQQRAGDGERGGADGAARGLGSAQAVPQQHEERGEEKPAARVAGDGDDGVQRRAQGRDAGGEAVIAVSQEAEGIERRGGGESPALPELFEQEGGERRAEYGGGEIPEVVKGALEEELREEAAQRELFQVPGIDVYGQVQGDAGEVDDGALFQEGAGAARVAEDEKAAGHEKERHRRACDLAREYEICRGAVGGEGRGVYGHDEQRGGDAEEVDAPVSARAHAGSLHSVRM